MFFRFWQQSPSYTESYSALCQLHEYTDSNMSHSEGRGESSHFPLRFSILPCQGEAPAYCQQSEQTVVRGTGAQERQEGGAERECRAISPIKHILREWNKTSLLSILTKFLNSVHLYLSHNCFFFFNRLPSSGNPDCYRSLPKVSLIPSTSYPIQSILHILVKMVFLKCISVYSTEGHSQYSLMFLGWNPNSLSISTSASIFLCL